MEAGGPAGHIEVAAEATGDAAIRENVTARGTKRRRRKHRGCWETWGQTGEVTLEREGRQGKEQNEEGGTERLREGGLQGGSSEQDGAGKALPREGLLQERGPEETAGPSAAVRPTSEHLQEESSAPQRAAPGTGPRRDSGTVYCIKADLRASPGGRLCPAKGCSRNRAQRRQRDCLLQQDRPQRLFRRKASAEQREPPI